MSIGTSHAAIEQCQQGTLVRFANNDGPSNLAIVGNRTQERLWVLVLPADGSKPPYIENVLGHMGDVKEGWESPVMTYTGGHVVDPRHDMQTMMGRAAVLQTTGAYVISLDERFIVAVLNDKKNALFNLATGELKMVDHLRDPMTTFKSWELLVRNDVLGRSRPLAIYTYTAP